jgi:hypothetical protein
MTQAQTQGPSLPSGPSAATPPPAPDTTESPSDPTPPSSPAGIPEDVFNALPAGFREKFTGQDGQFDLGKALTSHVEAERTLTQQQQNAAATPDSDSLKIPAADDATQSLDQMIAAMGMTKEGLGKEFQDNKGALNSETYQKFAGQGINRGMVDFGMEGLVATQTLAQQQRTNSVAAAELAATGGNPDVDGKAALGSLLHWAGSSGAFTDLEINGENGLQSQLDNPATCTMAVETIRSRHASALGAGNANPLLTGSTGGVAGGVTITKANVREMMQKARNGDSAALLAISAARDAGTLHQALL